MDAVTYSNKQVKEEISKNWVFIKCDISKEPDMKKLFDVFGIPLAFALNPEGIVLKKIEGFVEPEAFLDQVTELEK